MTPPLGATAQLAWGQDWDCSYGAPLLAEALRHQQAREGYRLRNNEIVIEPASVRSRLPAAVEGFFFLRRSDAAQVTSQQRSDRYQPLVMAVS